MESASGQNGLKRKIDMKIIYYSIFFILILLVGCASTQHATIQQSKIDSQQTNFSFPHLYEILVVDTDGNALDGVNIEYIIKDAEETIKKGSYITNSDGIFIESLNVTYESEFNFKASRDGFEPKNGSITRKGQQIKPEKVILIRTNQLQFDYFSKDFDSSPDVDLKTKVSTFLNFIIAESFYTKSPLEKKSINLVSFKNNSYLKFRFKNTNIYNSIRFNKYDIGKILFDEVIRKISIPLNIIGRLDLFYGYDLTVIGYTKSFAEEDSTVETIEYRFLIPVETVSNYKNQDISGQQVLDKSIILMDNERIELKLQ